MLCILPCSVELFPINTSLSLLCIPPCSVKLFPHKCFPLFVICSAFFYAKQNKTNAAKKPAVLHCFLVSAPTHKTIFSGMFQNLPRNFKRSLSALSFLYFFPLLTIIKNFFFFLSTLMPSLARHILDPSIYIIYYYIYNNI